MRVVSSVSMRIECSEDIVAVRQAVRKQSVGIGLNLVDQTKVVTACSELARNTLDYGGGGGVLLEIIDNGSRTGLRVTFTDEGPGIVNIDRALADGFTTGNGMGLGLGGAKRLSHEFEIWSEPGKGTRISIVRWK